MSTIKELTHEGAMGQAVKGFSKIIAVSIILIVAGFGDVMYIQAMSSKFPDGGPLLIMCYIGAFTSFLAVGYLLIGKSQSFRPGAQMLAAWIVFVVELVVIALNILLVFTPNPTGVMAAWASVAPATPVIHMLGVALIFFLDPDLRDKHHAMEIKSDMDKSERDLEYTTFKARISLRSKQTEHLTKALADAVNSPESLAYIRQYGYAVNMSLLTELTGVPAQLSAPAAPAALGLGQPVSTSEAASLDRRSVEPDKQKRSVLDRLGDALKATQTNPYAAEDARPAALADTAPAPIPTPSPVTRPFMATPVPAPVFTPAFAPTSAPKARMASVRRARRERQATQKGGPSAPAGATFRAGAGSGNA